MKEVKLLTLGALTERTWKLLKEFLKMIHVRKDKGVVI